jgi:hypothetical protein
VNGFESALWILLRDVFLTAVGMFMLLHETLGNPRLIVLMVGLVVLSGPATIRIIVTTFFVRGKE